MPSEFGFEPRSPRYGPFLVLGLFDTNNAHLSHFWRLFGPFLGHIVELEGKKGLLGMGQSRRTWSVATVSLRLADLNGFSGPFSGKKGCFCAQNAQFWQSTPPGRHR